MTHCPKSKKRRPCDPDEAGLCRRCGKDRWGRSARDRALIKRQVRVCLRHRKLYRVAKAHGQLREWLELVTAKLMWLHVRELERGQSQRLYYAARERDALIWWHGQIRPEGLNKSETPS